MFDLVQHFTEEKHAIRQRLESNPTPENTLRVLRSYFSKLHNDYSKAANIHHARQLNALLDLLQSSLSAINTIEGTTVTPALPRQTSQPEPSSVKWVSAGKFMQIGLILMAVLVLVNASLLWILLLLFVMLWLIEKFVQTAVHGKKRSWMTAFLLARGRKFFAAPVPPPHAIQPPPQAQTNVRCRVKTQRLLNYVADALAGIQRFLQEIQTDSSQDDGLFDAEPQLLHFFQDMFEAQYDSDGKWALKKVSQLTPLLEKHGILVKDFDLTQLNDKKCFDFDLSDDPDYRTIRPAFLKEERVLLRGLVNVPRKTGDEFPTENF